MTFSEALAYHYGSVRWRNTAAELLLLRVAAMLSGDSAEIEEQLRVMLGTPEERPQTVKDQFSPAIAAQMAEDDRRQQAFLDRHAAAKGKS